MFGRIVKRLTRKLGSRQEPQGAPYERLLLRLPLCLRLLQPQQLLLKLHNLLLQLLFLSLRTKEAEILKRFIAPS
jgi:hypothetical protein